MLYSFMNWTYTGLMGDEVPAMECVCAAQGNEVTGNDISAWTPDQLVLHLDPATTNNTLANVDFPAGVVDLGQANQFA